MRCVILLLLFFSAVAAEGGLVIVPTEGAVYAYDGTGQLFVKREGAFVPVQKVWLFDSPLPEWRHLGREDHPSVRIEWGCGINNTKRKQKRSAELISMLASNYNVHYVYHQSMGVVGDVASGAVNRFFNWITKCAERICQGWEQHFAKQDGIIVRICHSEGTFHTLRALELAPQKIRERIYVIAVAPAAHIPVEMCADVVHLCCENDPIPFAFAVPQATLHGGLNTFRFLKPYKDKDGVHHSFFDKTYREELESRIRDFIR